MLFSLVPILLAFNIVVLNAQSSSVDDSNSNDPVVQQRPIEKPAGLPNVEWDILKIDPASRENLCQLQIAYCSNNCGGPNEAPRNFCNSTSMAWGCGCTRKTPDFTPFLWPVVQAECSGKAQECRMICNTDKLNPSTCATTCNSYYQCGTDKAPPSYLQTEGPADTPSYNGPPKTLNATGDTDSSNSSSSTQSSNSNSAFISINNDMSFYFFITLVSTTAAAAVAGRLFF